MSRAIFEVYAKVIDANGAYNTLTGYPKVYDSNSYDGDVEKALARARGEYHTCLGTMYPRDDRQAQFVMVLDSRTGLAIESGYVGVNES